MAGAAVTESGVKGVALGSTPTGATGCPPEDSGVTAAGAHDANRRMSRLKPGRRRFVMYPFLFYN
jgi:hypothetical protein